MDEILQQLGGLVLGSVPTMVLFILLVTAYGLLVRRPLDRVLAERRAGPSRVLQEMGAERVSFGSTAEVDPFANLNTPAELAAAEAVSISQ